MLARSVPDSFADQLRNALPISSLDESFPKKGEPWPAKTQPVHLERLLGPDHSGPSAHASAEQVVGV